MKQKIYKSWNIHGIKRFNKLVQIVKVNQACSESKETEVKLKFIWIKLSLISAKLSDNCNTNTEGTDGDEQDSDYSTDGESNIYDGFASIEIES